MENIREQDLLNIEQLENICAPTLPSVMHTETIVWDEPCMIAPLSF